MQKTLLAAAAATLLTTTAYGESHGDAKATALAAFQAPFTDFSEESVRATIADDFTQHNPMVPDGRDALIGFLPGLKASGIAWTNHRVLQDGDFVVLHNSFTNAQAFGAPDVVTFDIYRMEDGMVAEHWDAIQPVATPTVSGRSMVDGPTEVTDLDQTEANKALAVALIEDVLMGKDPSKITDYISADAYAQHNPYIADGLSGIVAAVEALTAANNMFVYKEIHAVLGEGNFVLTVSEGEWGGQAHAFYDLFRMDGRKIVEHWDVIQPVPTEGLANTNGMFTGFDAN